MRGDVLTSLLDLGCRRWCAECMQQSHTFMDSQMSPHEIGALFRRALRRWSDEEAWLATPLPALVADDELDGALLLRSMTREVLEQAQAIFTDDTPTARLKLHYVRARVTEVPIAQVARQVHKGRRTLVAIQTRTDRLLVELFLRKFTQMTERYRQGHATALSPSEARRTLAARP